MIDVGLQKDAEKKIISINDVAVIKRKKIKTESLFVTTNNNQFQVYYKLKQVSLNYKLSNGEDN